MVREPLPLPLPCLLPLLGPLPLPLSLLVPVPLLLPLMMLLMFHSVAEKNLVKHVEETAQQQWLEMGVLSVTFTAYIAPDGLTVVDT